MQTHVAVPTKTVKLTTKNIYLSNKAYKNNQPRQQKEFAYAYKSNYF